MTVFVDNLWYWRTECVKYVLVIGKQFPDQPTVRVCNMFSDCLNRTQAEFELRTMAVAIGATCQQFREGPHEDWTQQHYDVTEEQRAKAVKLGAVEVDWHEAQRHWFERTRHDRPYLR